MTNRPANGQGFETAPFIIPVFIPQAGCPHRCIFCDQRAITGTPYQGLDIQAAQKAIQSFLEYRRDPNRFTEIAFFGGNFLGLDVPDIQQYLELAAGYESRGEIQGIRFSTRPDTITDQSLNLLDAFPVTTVELGAQSMDDDVLARSRRGHQARDTCKAVARLKSRGYRIGLQMMVGLPGDSEKNALLTGHRLADLAPDFVRIYPTVVLKNSPLVAWYREGRFRPLDLATAVDWTKSLYRLFTQRNIAVIRMGLPASTELSPDSALVAGPHHPAFGHLVKAALFYDRAIQRIDAHTGSPKEMRFRLHPHSISQFRGLANTNISKLQEKYDIRDIRILPDETLARDELVLE